MKRKHLEKIGEFATVLRRNSLARDVQEWGSLPSPQRKGKDKGLIRIRERKGKRDRVVPIGERALSWLEKYVAEVRPHFVVQPDDFIIFLTAVGGPFTPNHLSWLARRYVRAAKVGKNGACHIFRHTMATLMLEGGADIRYIQAMLGHVRLDTTRIYTHVSIRVLKQIHTATHPAAQLVQQGPNSEGSGAK